MIITVSDCKTFLQITGSTYDALIKKLIPKIESTIVKYCNNEFIDRYEALQGIMPTIYYYSQTISFANSDNSLNGSDDDFTTLNFKAGDSVRFYNTLHNNSCYTISSIAESKIIFEDINTIVDENEGNTIVFARVTYPEQVQMVAVDMISYKLNSKNSKILKSEKLDDYSYTNFSADEMILGYPKSIMSGLDDYCSAFLKTIPVDILYYRQV